MAEHWFDALNKMVIRGAPRRALIGMAAGILGQGVFDDPGGVAKKRKRKRKKRKRQRKGKEQPRAQTCSRGACADAFAASSDRDFCEFICAQCDGNDPRDFCIVASGQTQVAFCCAEGRECCDGVCCGPDPIAPGRRCCDQTCVNTLSDPNHCGTCSNACSPGKDCRNGVCDCLEGLTRCGAQCLNASVDEFNCGACGVVCGGATNRCCDGECVDIRSNRNHCGACGPSCSGADALCCNGDCVSSNRDELNCGGCGQTCLGEGRRCCTGVCVDTRTDPDNCGLCGEREPGFLCCGGHLYDPTRQFCCADGLRPCFTSQVCCIVGDNVPACCSPP